MANGRRTRKTQVIDLLAGVLSGVTPMVGVPLALLRWMWALRSTLSCSIVWARVAVNALIVFIYGLATATIHTSIVPAITFANLALPALMLPLAVGIVEALHQREHHRADVSSWYVGVALGLTLVATVASVEFAIHGRASVLRGHPNLLAHGSVLMGTAALLGGAGVTKAFGWGSAILIAVLAGSRTAILAWLIGSIVFSLRPGGRGQVRNRLKRLLPIALTAVAAIVLLTLPRWTSVWYAFVPPTNLLVDTEDLTLPTWRSRGLSVTPRGDAAPREFEVARDGGPSWQRLQQDLWLGPGAVTVTLSGVVARDSLTTPTLSIRATSAGTSDVEEGFAVSIRLTAAMDISVSNGEATRVLSASAAETDDGTALRATIGLKLPAATLFTFGVSPSHVDGPGSAIVHSLMVTTKRFETYIPGVDNKWLSGRMAVIQRMTFYEIAASLIRERPLFGWGTVDVRSILDSANAQIDPRLQGYPLTHAHNALLQIILTFGLSGLALLCVVAVVSLPKKVDVIVPSVMLVTLQTLDFTLLNGDVLWSATVAVAVAGVHHARSRPRGRPR